MFVNVYRSGLVSALDRQWLASFTPPGLPGR